MSRKVSPIVRSLINLLYMNSFPYLEKPFSLPCSQMSSAKCISKGCGTFCIRHAQYKTVNYHIQCNPRTCQFILQKDIPSPNLSFQSKALGHLNLSKSLLTNFHMFKKESESESHSVISDSLQPHRQYNPWNSPG